MPRLRHSACRERVGGGDTHIVVDVVGVNGSGLAVAAAARNLALALRRRLPQHVERHGHAYVAAEPARGHEHKGQHKAPRLVQHELELYLLPDFVAAARLAARRRIVFGPCTQRYARGSLRPSLAPPVTTQASVPY